MLPYVQLRYTGTGEHGHGGPPQSSHEAPEGVSSPKKGEKKPQKPGKYVCSYCGRPCAKPSVLEKHIRSHTGERPYPCAPCGFSFKTKSNLYKHRKSHAHRIKVGLASSRDEPCLSGPEGSSIGEDPEEHTEGESTESEDETGQRKKSSSKKMLRQQRKAPKERPEGSEESQRPEDSQAVKQRLALRLRKRGPRSSPDDPPSSSLSTSSSSLGPGSKGSTESGYFSGSGSTDLSQVSPPSSSAKTYAEIILGKYGRLGGQQRSPHQHQLPTSHSSSSGTEEKSIPFAVPKTQVIEHITKLITINEAVVDTSEIDSVKPRRSSLSRKSSMESPKFIAPKDPYAFDPKIEAAGPSGLRHPQNPEADLLNTQELSAVPLLRSHSLPSSSSQVEHFTSGTMSPRGYRLSQSFDEQQAVVAEMRGTQRMLRRQPAIEVPLGAESMLEAGSPLSSARGTHLGKQPHEPQKSQSVFECRSCGACCQHSEGYEAHIGTCTGPKQEGKDACSPCRETRPPLMHSKFRALAIAVRKRRKEESLEEDPPSPGTVPMAGSAAGLISVLSRPDHSQALSEPVAWASGSQSSQMLMVPSVSHQQHQSHKEMRRSASEQAPPRPQQTEQISDTRSKSFDYGSLSSQQSTSSWKERRKVLLVKQATLGEPEQEMVGGINQSPIPGPSHPNIPYLYPTEVSPHFCLDAEGKPMQLIQSQMFSPSHNVLPLQPIGHAFQTGALSQLLPITTAITEVLSPHVIHRAFLHSQSGSPSQTHPGQMHLHERLRIPLHHLTPLVSLPSSSGVRSSQPLRFPVLPRIGTHIPSQSSTETRPPISSISSSLTHHSLVAISYRQQQPVIATCLAQLPPVVSLVVPVRLQTHRPTFASAMYTTLSQILASTHSQVSTSCTAMIIMAQTERDKLQESYLRVPSSSIQSLFPLSLSEELSSVSGEAYGPLGSGGSKRMLSPAASLELSTEAKRHQKRVKEEEEEQYKSVEEEENVEPKVSQEEESKIMGKTLEEGEKQQTDRIEGTMVKLEEVQERVQATPPSTLPEVKDDETHEKTYKKKTREEEAPSTSKQGEPSLVRIFEGG
ncbi:hypothetical protein GOODEAATRI_005465 [Goodea atripinnis]|uniref:C2H2-type domain-containing protein n=1 Tax=Goodea atripinnis TaxID=208336 RepID=A0ABV0PL62_9TELE